MVTWRGSPLMNVLNRPNRSLSLVVLVGIIVRAVVVPSFLNEGFAWPDEMNQYYPQALRLFQGLGWGDNTKILPLFPFLVSLIFSVSHGDLLITRLVVALINSSLIVVVYALSKTLFDGRVALLSALLTSVYPILVYSSGLLLPETLFCLLVCTGLWLVLNGDLGLRNIGLAGLCFGLASLTSALTLPFLFLSLPVLLFRLRLTSALRRISYLAAYALVLASLVGGWGLRNYLSEGTFVIVKRNVGEVLYLHNNALASGFDRRANRLNANTFAPEMEDKVSNVVSRERDREYLLEAVSFIRGNPLTFMRLCVERFLNLWRFYPGTISLNDVSDIRFQVISILTYGPVLALSLMGVVLQRKEWRRHLIVYSYVFSLILTFTVFRSSMRARLPLEPILVMYASVGAVSLCDYVRRSIQTWKHRGRQVC